MPPTTAIVKNLAEEIKRYAVWQFWRNVTCSRATYVHQITTV
jgi:hypothetical protein